MRETSKLHSKPAASLPEKTKTGSMPYVQSLTREVKEMWALVLSQHHKSLMALVTLDKDLAREIILIEERVNSSEQFIESDCEHYFSLKGTAADKIAHVLSVLKITRRLEIIGDLAKKIAGEILDTPSAYSQHLLEAISITELFRRSNRILELALDAFEGNDSALPQLIRGRIEVFNEMAGDTPRLLVDYLRAHPDEVSKALSLCSVVESLKRVVDLTRDMTEGFIRQEFPVKLPA